MFIICSNVRKEDYSHKTGGRKNALQKTVHVFKRKRVNGKPILYFRIYLPDGTRRAKSTGCTSKEKAMMFVENILDDENLLH